MLLNYQGFALVITKTQGPAGLVLHEIRCKFALYRGRRPLYITVIMGRRPIIIGQYCPI